GGELAGEDVQRRRRSGGEVAHAPREGPQSAHATPHLRRPSRAASMLYARGVSPTPAATGEPATPFPDGAWFSVAGHVRLGAGGQARMVLLRHRLFLQAGLDFPILTDNPVPSYEPARAGLVADGLLLPES